MIGVDLFSGAGGMTLGAKMAGINVVFAVEADPHAAKTYAANHPEVKLYANDIRRLRTLPSLASDEQIVLFGGPPCQGFSTSNQRTRSRANHSNWMFREFVRVARLSCPDWIVFENVKGIAETENGAFLAMILKQFRKIGYTLSTGILNAADYGVPQKRERLFVIGSLHGFEVPMPKPSVRKPIAIKNALNDLPDLANGAQIEELPYKCAARSTYARTLRTGSKLSDTAPFTTTAIIRRRFSVVSPMHRHLLPTAVLTLILAGRLSAAETPEVLLDVGKTEATYEGIGALSAGASSRLLIDYPEPQRSEILDYLFKPHFGAAIQHLKVEIGGDADSTCGTEPSIAFSREEFVNPKPACFQRGYEWWLMKEAKKRNPNIIFDVLQWGAPGWVGNGKFYSQDNADLIAAFIQGARKYHDLDISYCGIWNEKMYDEEWIKLLRNTLNRAGLQHVAIVAADEVSKWTIADKMAKDPALCDAVQVIGTHYPNFMSTPTAQSFGKRLWSSEDGPWKGTWEGARALAMKYNRNYAVGRMTKTIIWSPVTSYYDILPLPGSGFMRANEPWSGHYEVQPAVWATAHTTQFIQPGWKYLGGGACALLPAGGSRVAAVSPNAKAFGLVVETIDAAAPQELGFRLAGGLNAKRLSLWKSTQQQQFVRQPDLPVTDGAFRFTAEPNAIYSVTNTSGQQKGTFAAIPAHAPLPLPYVENFDGYQAGKTPKYLSDFYGVFETAVAPDGRPCLEQKTPAMPITWTPVEDFAFTVVGGDSWRNYTVACDVRMDFKQDARILGRIGSVAHGGRLPAKGYCLTVRPDGAWELGTPDKKLLEGKAALTPDAWHNFGLRFEKDQITVLIDGKEAGHVNDGTYKSGLIGLGCQREPVRFSHLRVTGPMPIMPRKVTSSSDWSADHTAGQVLVFGQRWNAAEGKSAGEWLEFDFGAPKNISGVDVVQFGKRITDCTLQAWRDGQWIDIASAKPTAEPFEFSFAPAKTAKIRLRVNATQGGQTPSIHTVQAWEEGRKE